MKEYSLEEHFLIPFSIENRFQETVIVGHDQTYLGMLSDWFKPAVQVNGQWILYWRASLHGWAVKTLNSFCDDKGPLVTRVKDTNNNKFGGYASIPWREFSSYAIACLLYTSPSPRDA